jgi:succinoglycan biosynthesis transport protein ExoP
MEEEISLRELIEVMLAGKWIIILITIAAMLLSVVVSFGLLEPTYEAKTVLAVNQNNLPKSPSDGLEGLVNTFSGMPQVSVQSYVSQAKSAAVLNKVMERLNIDPHETSLNTFANKITINNIKDTELLEITVKDKSPEKAAEIANVLAEELVEFISTTNKLRTQKTLAFLEKQVKEEQNKLGSSVEEMKQFLKQPDTVAELEAELDTNLLLLSEFQARKANLQVEIKKTGATITALEKQLLDVPEKVELKKNLFDDPALYQLYTEKVGVSDISKSGLELRSEEINPVYMELKNELELNKAMLAQLAAEKTSAEAEIARMSEAIKDIQVKLADRKTQLEQLQMEIDTARENYVLFNNKYTESQVTESMKIGEATLMIVSPAYQPTVPVAPKKALNLAVATCLGLMLGVFIVLFRSYWVNSTTDTSFKVG